LAELEGVVELSGVARLGKVCGVLGVALGIVAVLLQEVLGSLHLVPESARPMIVMVVAVLAGLLIAGAILAYVIGSNADAQKAATRGAHADAVNIDKRKNAAAPQRATTKGDNSSARNERG